MAGIGPKKVIREGDVLTVSPDPRIVRGVPLRHRAPEHMGGIRPNGLRGGGTARKLSETKKLNQEGLSRRRHTSHLEKTQDLNELQEKLETTSRTETSAAKGKT